MDRAGSGSIKGLLSRVICAYLLVCMQETGGQSRSGGESESLQSGLIRKCIPRAEDIAL